MGKKVLQRYTRNTESNKYVHHLNYGYDFTKIYMSKFNKFYILLYVNYTAIKFKNIEKIIVEINCNTSILFIPNNTKIHTLLFPLEDVKKPTHYFENEEMEKFKYFFFLYDY